MAVFDEMERVAYTTSQVFRMCLTRAFRCFFRQRWFGPFNKLKQSEPANGAKGQSSQCECLFFQFFHPFHQSLQFTTQTAILPLFFLSVLFQVITFHRKMSKFVCFEMGGEMFCFHLFSASIFSEGAFDTALRALARFMLAQMYPCHAAIAGNAFNETPRTCGAMVFQSSATDASSASRNGALNLLIGANGDMGNQIFSKNMGTSFSPIRTWKGF